MKEETHKLYMRRFMERQQNFVKKGRKLTLRVRQLFDLNGAYFFLQNRWNTYDIGRGTLGAETFFYISFGPLVVLW